MLKMVTSHKIDPFQEFYLSQIEILDQSILHVHGDLQDVQAERHDHDWKN